MLAGGLTLRRCCRGLQALGRAHGGHYNMRAGARMLRRPLAAELGVRPDRRVNRKESHDPQPPWLLSRIREQRMRLVETLGTAWPIPHEPEPSTVDVESALSDIEMILGACGEAHHVADYLYSQGARMLGGMQPQNRGAVPPLAEAIVRIHEEIWHRDQALG